MQAHLISTGEENSDFSARDGKLMRRHPEGTRFTVRGLAQHLQARARTRWLLAIVNESANAAGKILQDALVGIEYLVHESLSEYMSCPSAKATGPHARNMLYAFRGMALIQAGAIALALKASAAFSFCTGRAARA